MPDRFIDSCFSVVGGNHLGREGDGEKHINLCHYEIMVSGDLNNN